ncbi:MAG TPA: tetratricopeptide repeat protein [Gemmatimonadales bacterium]|nr:tetratricopeptide repeat protein [Gemmatimonadales bacterium]
MRTLIAGLLLLCAAPLAAQNIEAEIRAGDSLHLALRPAEALTRFHAVLAADSNNYAALWRASRETIDIAKQIEGDQDSLKDRRDSLYGVARAYAEAAVRVDSNRAEGHSFVAQSLGRLSLTRGGKERVRFAKIIYDEAMRAITLDSTEDAPYHVIGAWHAEVKRLSSFTRFFAKTLFGAGFMGRANWDDAQRYLERSVALKPSNVYHRLELARVYIDVGKYTAARDQLATIHGLPIGDVLDPKYKAQAAQLLADIKDKQDKS